MRPSTWVCLPFTKRRSPRILPVIFVGTVTLLSHLLKCLVLDKVAKFQESQDSFSELTVIYSNIKKQLVINRSSAYGTYQIHSNVYVGYPLNRTDVIKKDDTTLVTQCSVEHLDKILPLASIWDGPISVAVFAPSHSLLNLIKYIIYLHMCFSAKISYQYIHIVRMFPDRKYHLPGNINSFLQLHPVNCSSNFCFDRKENFNDEFYEYPTNVMRNVAIYGARTEYIFVIDIDMIPNMHLQNDFHMYIATLGKEESLSVYVVPAFEIKETVTSSVPKEKSRLLQMLNSGDIRSFYEHVCYTCHSATNVEKWRALNNSQLEVAYEVDWKEPWEPYFIIERKSPLYDERFLRYGFNRLSQICELFIAGYTFHVLNNAFLLHRGFKSASNIHQNREIEVEENRYLYERFKEELMQKYPNTSRNC